jgi:seryl-tRNA synthetase
MIDAKTQEAYRKYTDELVAAGHLIPSGVPGVVGRGEMFEKVVRHFEACVTRAGAVLKPQVMSFPPILNRTHYLTTDHIHNFPNLMGSVHSFDKGEREQVAMLDKLQNGQEWTQDLSPTGVMMIPAVCYPLYPASSGTLPEGGKTVDTQGYVFRHEPSPDPARMQIFRQREFIRLGSPQEAVAHRDFWIETGKQVLKDSGLDVQIVVANDPFFGRGGRLRKATQREQDLKHEFVIPICSEEHPTAIASCNCHLESFGTKFDIKTADGEVAHSSCIGFGLERVTLALFKKHGLDPREWPRSVRAYLRLED